MRAVQMVALVVATTAVTSLVVPSTADAFFRVGAEARWAPVAGESMTEDGESLEASRSLESVGFGLRALLGFEYFSVGAKANFTRHTFSESELSYSQLDLNAHVRSGMPLTRLNFFGEAGPTVALAVGGVGYNVSVGAEVDILGWPLIDMNLGLAGQYVDVPIGAGPDAERRNQGVRAVLKLGVDFSLID